jgi:hypothetical protein
MLLEIASAVRRYKSEQGMSLGAALSTLVLDRVSEAVGAQLVAAAPDLRSVTRAGEITIREIVGETVVLDTEAIRVGVVA